MFQIHKHPKHIWTQG